MTPAESHISIAEVRALLSEATGRELAGLLGRFACDERAGVTEACRRANSREQARRQERTRTKAMYALERKLQAGGFSAVAGVDEVGRGALAGPVSAAAVILPAGMLIEGLNDSKKLTPARREELSALIHARALSVGIAHVSAAQIDSEGLSAALRRAILSAILQLEPQPDHVVIDGLPMRVHPSETAVVKGDSKVAAVAAASIVAKVARDALMREAALVCPEYGFEINKGYGTAEHKLAVDTHGPSCLHRLSFNGGGGNPSLF